MTLCARFRDYATHNKQFSLFEIRFEIHFLLTFSFTEAFFNSVLKRSSALTRILLHNGQHTVVRKDKAFNFS